GGTLVYNPRRSVIPAVTLIGDNGVPITLGGHAGPLHDPTGMMYVRTADLVAAPVTAAEKLACSLGGALNPLCPVKLKPSAPVEPIEIRAAAGDCVRVTLRNRLPGDRNRDGFLNDAPELANYNTIMGVVKRDRGVEGTAQGATTFNANLIRPSSYVGLHPQLMEYDVTLSDGANVGINNPLLPQTAPPGSLRLYIWYAGNLDKVPVSATSSRINAKAVEFGGFNLSPADKIKQGQKGLVGAMTVEPAGATITEADLAWDHQQGDPLKTRLTRASATINKGTAAEFRDFSVVFQKDLSLRYADGAPVEHLNGEAVGIPEDSQESTNMGINYGSEPMWFRFGLAPNAPFGHAVDAVGNGVGFGDVENAHEGYSNVLTAGADPATPVFKATAGKEFRMHVGVPFGTSRGSTFNLHGHVWQRAPYLAEFTDPATGMPRDYALGGPGLGSVKIGNNPLSFYQSGQESITPYAHFDLRLPSAGGANAVKGDYLFRDQAGLGNAGGLWGIVRVQ
ncbi:MAG: hypothetical protein PHP88_12690, partial [bacterium]|nr:hypothetical protein [bacterium]